MSIFKNKQRQQTGVTAAVSHVATLLNTRGAELTSRDAVSMMVSNESISDVAQQDAIAIYQDAEQEVRNALAEGLGVSPESLTDSQVEAATITMLAHANPSAYQHAAQSTTVVGTEGVDVMSQNITGSNGNIDARLNPGFESFDDNDLRGYLPMSIVFNAAGALQDEFGEAFYPTQVLTPDVQGYEVKLQYTTVMNAVKRAITGDVTDFAKRSIIEAAVKSDILESTAGDIVPFVMADESNAAYFVDKAVIPYTAVDVNGKTVNTSPLAIDAEFDLLGMSRPAGTVGGVLDHTDQIAQGVTLSAIYVKFAKADDSASSIHRIATKGLPRSYFLADQEGESRNTTLNFSNNDFAFTADSVDLAGVAGAGLAVVPAGHTLKVGFKVIGDCNLDTGVTSLNAPVAKVTGLVDASDKTISIKAGAGKTVADDVVVTVLGYDLDAKYSNTNLRTEGLLVDTSTISEKYRITLGAPISAQKPVGAAAGTGIEVKSLINTLRVAAKNRAVTSLLNYVEAIKQFKPVAGQPVAQVPGIGRYVVTPTYMEENIDFDTDAVLNVMRSHEKREDIQAVICDMIRSMAYEMNRKSGYSAALEADQSGVGVKPRLVIGTDEVLQQYLMITGDDRTVSVGYDHTIVTTPDERMEDKIIFTFSRGKAGDALSFGTRAFVPELASTQNIQFDGSVKAQTTVQPREGNFNHLPIVGVINVKNLEKVLGKKV